MKKYFITLFLLFSILLVFGQQTDKIYLKNKEVISGKILRVTDVNVEIDPEGSKPFLIIKRENVSVIIYSDNSVVNFNESQERSSDVITKKKDVKRAGGFRTDGYYITEYALEWQGRAREPITGWFQIDTQTYHLYLAFRVRPDHLDQSKSSQPFIDENFYKVDAALLKSSKKQYRKVTKTDPKYLNSKNFFEEFLKDKAEKLLLEVHLESNNLYFNDPPFLVSIANIPPTLFYRQPENGRESFSIIVGNFKGLNKDIVIADFHLNKILGVQFLSPHSMDGSDKNGRFNQFKYYTSKSGNYETNGVIVLRNRRLTFIPDN